MNKVQDARRVELVVQYNGKDISTDLTKSLLDLSYTDGSNGTLDELQIDLEDKDLKWQGPWSPAAGDKIQAEIRTINWNKPGETKKLPLGLFEVDSFGFQGPPDTVSIKAVSLPTGSEAKQEKRTKAWEKVTLKTLAGEVAGKAGLTLVYEVTDNPTYTRLDQTGVSDMSFLKTQATKEGIAVKVVEKKLVLFDESEYEKKVPVTTLERGKDHIISYSFSLNTANAAYSSCEVSYTDGKKKQTIKAVYKPPNAPKGPTLKINERADDYAAALRIAKKSLRKKNKESGKGSLSLMGDVRLATGLTITIKGYGRFDGKYIIDKCTHQVSSRGYVTDIEIRKVLGW